MWAVMNAYNKVNGLWCAENPFLLSETLQKRWGFKGFVISDWGSTYSTAATVAAGMNLEMPGGEAMRTWFARPETQKDGNGAGWLTSRESACGGGRRPIETGGGGRLRAAHLARDVYGRAVRQRPRRRRRGGYSGTEGGGAHGRDRKHRAAEERGRRASAGRSEDPLGGGDRSQRRDRQNRRRWKLTGPAEVLRHGARRHQGGRRSAGAGRLRAGSRHARRGREPGNAAGARQASQTRPSIWRGNPTPRSSWWATPPSSSRRVSTARRWICPPVRTS